MRLHVFLLALLLAAPLHAVTFAVDSTVDAVDMAPGDGVCASAADGCTLRAAIEETNALPGADVVEVPAGTYQLAAGTLVISDDLTIRGAGPRDTILDGGQMDGVLHVLSSSLDLSSLTVQNAADAQPAFAFGIVWASSGDDTLTVADAVIRANEAGLWAICTPTGSLLVERTAIVGNSEYGIALLGCQDATLANSTLSGNQTGLWNVSSGASVPPRVVSTTITLNQFGVNNTIFFIGPGCGRGGCPDPGPLDIRGSIVSGNGVDCAGGTDEISSLGGNLDADGTCNLTEPTDLPNIDPMLGPLQDNGGPSWTHALLPGSVAIDAIPVADCTYDHDGDPGTPEVPVASGQRGVLRPQNANCDIGAYEVTACADGAHNDGDGLMDYPDDPGCRDAASLSESPQCQDGINNDPGQDPDPGLIDFDGGLSALGYVASEPDPQCVGMPWKNKEKTGVCGLGVELALILPGLMWLHNRKRRPA